MYVKSIYLWVVTWEMPPVCDAPFGGRVEAVVVAGREVDDGVVQVRVPVPPRALLVLPLLTHLLSHLTRGRGRGRRRGGRGGFQRRCSTHTGLWNGPEKMFERIR